MNEAMPDLYAMADYMISRSGANSVCEILALEKPHIFIPLPLSVSRGDQIENAAYCKADGLSMVLEEEKLTAKMLCDTVNTLEVNAKAYKAKIKAKAFGSGTENIIQLIEAVAK